MNKSGDLKNPLGQLKSIPKKTVEQLVKEPLEVVEEAEVQAGAKMAEGNASNPNKDTLEVVKKMYEASESKINVPSDKIISAVIQENPKKTPEEIQKMAATRQQLWQQQHMTSYFEPTFNPKKEEPRPTEQIEKEKKEKKQMEALEIQKEEKKKEELSPAVKQGTHEINPGVSG